MACRASSRSPERRRCGICALLPRSSLLGFRQNDDRALVGIASANMPRPTALTGVEPALFDREDARPIGELPEDATLVICRWRQYDLLQAILDIEGDFHSRAFPRRFQVRGF